MAADTDRRDLAPDEGHDPVKGAKQHHHHEHVPAGVRMGRLGRWFDARTGLARAGQGVLGKIFPNHWSFMLGEVALYSFVVLVLTGVFLTFFYEASTATTVYNGSYAPLHGVEVSEAYNSGLDISFDVKAGLVIRQIHHWAALVFLAAIVAHLMRVFFTGAFRRPRELNWVIGCGLFLMALANGFAGYSLLDDQLSGTGLRIAYSVAISIPVVGPWIASWLFGGNFPGADIIPRLFVLHVLIIPILIGGLLTAHLVILIRHMHAHFPGKGATNHNVVGERLWPTYVFKAGGFFFIVAAVLSLLGALAQINPVWLYGPFRPENVSSASQPDWYMGWLEGALRLFPNWEMRWNGFTIPNPFWSGVVPAGIVFTILFAWPWIEARFTKDRSEHHVLDRPRDRPVRTALGVSALGFFTVLGVAGSNDVLAASFGISLNATIWIFRSLLLVAPIGAFLLTYKLCLELQRRDGPLAGGRGPLADEPSPDDGAIDPNDEPGDDPGDEDRTLADASRTGG